MTDLDFDALDIESDEEDANYARIRRDHLDGLREAAKAGTKARKRAEELERDAAFTTAGLTDLSQDRRDALTALVKDVNADALRDKAVSLGFIEAPAPVTPPVDEDEIAAHDAHAQAANGAGAPISNTLTAADIAGWSKDELNRFAATHPDLAMSLANGQTVTRPPGFAVA